MDTGTLRTDSTLASDGVRCRKNTVSGTPFTGISDAGQTAVSSTELKSILQPQAVTKKGVTVLALDSTYVKAHPDGTGAPKKGQQSIGKSRGGWTTKIHSVVADESTPLVHSLSAGSAGDSPEIDGGDTFGDPSRLYKQRNVVERNFRKIKEFRRVFTRYDKLDETYNAFIAIANIALYLKN